MEDTIDLRLETRTVGPWTVLDVGGEVDLYTAPALRERVIALVDEGHRRLVVNLEDVTFLDSSGLGVLVAGLKRLKESQGEMALVCREDPILKLFTITGLDRVFAIHDSVGDATAP